MQGYDIHDIVVGTVPFNRNRYSTAYALAELLQQNIEEKGLRGKFGQVIYVDIPQKTNKRDEYCLAFVCLSKTEPHQNFVEEFNGRIAVYGIALIIKMSRTARKELSKYYLVNDIGWYYQRDNKIDHNNTNSDPKNNKPDSVQNKIICQKTTVETLKYPTEEVKTKFNLDCLEALKGLSRVNQNQLEQ